MSLNLGYVIASVIFIGILAAVVAAQVAAKSFHPFLYWAGRLVAEALGNVSDGTVWRVVRKHDLQLDRRQSWCVSTDRSSPVRRAKLWVSI